MSNFNIDWQNNLLNRMTQGAQAVGGLATVGGNLMQGAGALNTSAAGLQDLAAQDIIAYNRAPYDATLDVNSRQRQAMNDLTLYGREAAQPYQQAFTNWQDIQNQFLAANQQSFNQNQISGFEDPFALLQLQSEIEMQREQMNMQEKMQEKQMKQQMGMQG